MESYEPCFSSYLPDDLFDLFDQIENGDSLSILGKRKRDSDENEDALHVHKSAKYAHGWNVDISSEYSQSSEEVCVTPEFTADFDASSISQYSNEQPPVQAPKPSVPTTIKHRYVTQQVVDLSKYFRMSIKDAAKELSISSTTLSSIWSRSINKPTPQWPCRPLRQLQLRINSVLHEFVFLENEYQKEMETLKVLANSTNPATANRANNQYQTLKSRYDKKWRPLSDEYALLVAQRNKITSPFYVTINCRPLS